MTAYRAILSARFRMLLQYRAAAVAGFGTQLFWGLIRVMIFTAFYRSTTAAQPMSLEQTVTYIWLGQAFFALTPIWADQEVVAMIRTGSVAYELARPVDLYNLWYCRAIAGRAAPTLLRAVPMFIVAGLFFGLGPPPSLASGVAWACSLAATLLLAAAITTILTVSVMWTVSGQGAAPLLNAAVYAFSGILVPLPLFPGWAQPILNALPFRGIFDVPCRIYMGHLPPQAAVGAIAQQVVWVVAIVLLGRWLVARGTRRLVVQGG